MLMNIFIVMSDNLLIDICTLEMMRWATVSIFFK